MGLEMVEIAIVVEEEFRVAVPDERLGECSTYGNLVDLIVALIRDQQPDTTDPEHAVDAFLRKTLVAEYSINPKHITRDAELFGRELDLG